MIFSGLEDMQNQWLSADSIISRGLWKDTVVATCTDLEDMLAQFYKWVDVGIPDPASADKLGQIDNIWDDFNLPLSLCLLGRMISERARLLSCSLFGRSGRLPHSTPAVREYQSSQGTLGCVRLSCNSDFPIDKQCNCQVVFYSRVVPWTCVWR